VKLPRNRLVGTLGFAPINLTDRSVDFTLPLWLGHLLDIGGRHLAAQNLAQGFFQYFVAAGADSCDRRLDHYIGGDANTLGWPLVGIEHSDATDTRVKVPGQNER